MSLRLDITSWSPATRLPWAQVVTPEEPAVDVNEVAAGMDIAGSGRVNRGELWALDGGRTRSGVHYLLCDSPGREPKAWNAHDPILCHRGLSAGRASDRAPKWWIPADLAVRIPGTWTGYWAGWEPLRAALAGELARAEWTPLDVKRITKDERASSWFEKTADWEFLPQAVYAMLSEYGQSKGVFAPPYGALLAFYRQLRRTYEEDASFLRPVLESIAKESDVVFEAGGTPIATILAAESVGCKCFAVDPRPGVCERALVLWESATGSRAERA